MRIFAVRKNRIKLTGPIGGWGRGRFLKMEEPPSPLMEDPQMHQQQPPPDHSPPEPEWGTKEELLLAAAVDRLGTTDWDLIAHHVRTRTSSPLLFTSDACRHRFHALRRRFAPDDADQDLASSGIRWLQDLRQLRVAELRQEVQRCDVSIGSLESKVKALEEEPERRSLEEKDVADPASGGAQTGAADAGDQILAVSAVAGGAGEVADEENRVAGDESDRENRSFNESNSTDPKEENPEIRAASEEENHRPTDSVQQSEQVDNAPTASGGGSRSESSGTVSGETRPAAQQVKSPDPVRAAETGESEEVHDSAGKESSDVQSSASLSRRRRRSKREFAGACSGSGDEVSPAFKMVFVRSQPLAGFLEIIRSHKFGSLFERRLETQDTEDYQLKVRQHIDLQMVSSKLQQGLYTRDHLLFFRDLLLLCTNANVFFPSTSDEFAAAVGLRRIITREMNLAIRKTRPLGAQTRPLQPRPYPGDRHSSSPEKPTSFKVKKTQPKTEIREPNHLSESSEGEPLVLKKRRRDRSASGLKGARSSRGKSAVTSVAAAAKADKPFKGILSTSVAKKRSAASFLDRMKHNSQSGSLLDTLKTSTEDSLSLGGSGGAETKKVGSHGSRRGSAGKQSGPMTPKRNVGRPPKKSASPVAKRRKDGAAKQQRKRGRR